jgi:glycerol kinase
MAGGLEEVARLQAEASEMDTDSHGLTVLPFFSGGNNSLGGSGSARQTAGTLTGMTLRTSRAGILRAILESVALQLKGIFASISPILPDDSFEVGLLGGTLSPP